MPRPGRAKESAPERSSKPNVEYRKWNIGQERCPVDVSSYDQVFMLDIIEHLNDPEGFMEMLRERKRRIEASEAYREAGRDDMAGAEEREAALIDAYLPEQLSDDELHAIVGDVVAETGAASPKEMGKVMSMVMPRVQGRADGKRVSAVVKEKLTA